MAEFSENFQKIENFEQLLLKITQKLLDEKCSIFFWYISDSILSIPDAFVCFSRAWGDHNLCYMSTRNFLKKKSGFVCSTHMHQFSIPDFSEKKYFSEKIFLKKSTLAQKSSNPEGFWLIPSRKKVSSF